MIKEIQVKDTVIGTGMPKICVPVTGATKSQILKQVQKITAEEPDLVEWRADFFESVNNLEAVKKMLAAITDKLGQIPLLFTFRMQKEGGERHISIQDYVNLNKMVSKTGLADLIDIEVFTEEMDLSALIDEIHQGDSKVVGSNHHFQDTPSLEELLQIFKKIDQVGADILKIAVMPRDEGDVLTLLTATSRMHILTEKPLITMSMGGQGVISRVSGEFFGSAITFGCVEYPSAPGQIEIYELKRILSALHDSL